MSWKSAAWPEEVELGLREPQLAADRQRELLHAPRVAGGVGVAGVDRRRQRLHRRGRALLEEPVGLLERDVLGLDRLGGLAQLLGALLRVAQVRLLRLAHEEQRHREDCEGEHAGGGVRDRDHAADEAVHDPVRGQPGEALLPGPPPALVALQREREADEAGVDREVGRSGREAGGDRDEVAQAPLEAGREDPGRGQRGQRERADVEEHVVDRRAPCAPLDDGGRDRERDRCPRTEERRARERTDGGDRDRAVVDLQRESLPDADQDHQGDQPEDVRLRCRRASPSTPAPTPTTATVPTRNASRLESDRKRGPCTACGRGWRRSSGGCISTAGGSGAV